MGVMMEISPKCCNIKAVTCYNNDFQLFSAKYDKNLKYIQLSTSLSFKFNTCNTFITSKLYL